MGPEDLTQLLPHELTQSNDGDLLLGIGDDAGVYRLTETLAIVQTTDFITPIVDDPFDFGAIAAANALSDLFAMGAEAKTALMLVMHDKQNVSFDDLRDIMRGGKSKIDECGAALLGGHTVSDLEMKFGLSVTGTIDPKRFWRNSAAQIGDRLILTKPLGMGILTTAGKADMATKVALNEAVKYMSRLNLYAMRAAREYEIHACTDITGFGLAGHALEMIRDDISIEFSWDQIPYLRSALSFASIGIVPGGTLANRDYAKDRVTIARTLSEPEELIFFDAQTSGGLLIAVSEADAEKCLEKIVANGDDQAAIVGLITPRSQNHIIIG
ncbi:selenide, water dikinase [Campylobacterota bacterium]|nr:selenide, water dikinase [Campylobacterota bacterium]